MEVMCMAWWVWYGKSVKNLEIASDEPLPQKIKPPQNTTHCRKTPQIIGLHAFANCQTVKKVLQFRQVVVIEVLHFAAFYRNTNRSIYKKTIGATACR